MDLTKKISFLKENYRFKRIRTIHEPQPGLFNYAYQTHVVGDKFLWVSILGKKPSILIFNLSNNQLLIKEQPGAKQPMFNNIGMSLGQSGTSYVWEKEAGQIYSYLPNGDFLKQVNLNRRVIDFLEQDKESFFITDSEESTLSLYRFSSDDNPILEKQWSFKDIPNKAVSPENILDKNSFLEKTSFILHNPTWTEKPLLHCLNHLNKVLLFPEFFIHHININSLVTLFTKTEIQFIEQIKMSSSKPEEFSKYIENIQNKLFEYLSQDLKPGASEDPFAPTYIKNKNGHIFISSRITRCSNKLLKINPNSELVESLSVGPHFFSSFDFDQNANLFTADLLDHSVSKYSSNLSPIFSTRFPEETFQSPLALTINKQNLYLLDNGLKCISIFNI